MLNLSKIYTGPLFLTQLAFVIFYKNLLLKSVVVEDHKSSMVPQ
jgi:hypothetical protein